MAEQDTSPTRAAPASPKEKAELARTAQERSAAQPAAPAAARPDTSAKGPATTAEPTPKTTPTGTTTRTPTNEAAKAPTRTAKKGQAKAPVRRASPKQASAAPAAARQATPATDEASASKQVAARSTSPRTPADEPAAGTEKRPHRVAPTKPVRKLEPAETTEPGTGRDEESTPPVPISRAMQARKVCRTYMMVSAAAGAVPAPVVDMAALAAVQLKMVHSLAAIYEVPFSRELGHAAVATLITSLGGPSVARGTFGSLIKVIPVVGSLAGVLTLPALAAAASYAVARTFILHFETGGTLLDFDAKKMREHFLELYREGGKVADDMIGGEQ